MWDVTANVDVEADAAVAAVETSIEDLRRELQRLRRRDEGLSAAIRRLNEQLEEAASIHRDLLSSPQPFIHGARVFSFDRPAETVGGDFQYVRRLDESHVAMALADATGHGLPAGMLAVFVQRSIRAAEHDLGSAGALTPETVLERVNAEFLDANLKDCQFAAILYAVYDESTHIIRWARAGACYPILVRQGVEPRQIVSAGPLAGVSRDPRFEIAELRLSPGDSLVFHSDGLEALLLGEQAAGGCGLGETDWVQDLGDSPIDRQLESLKWRLDAARADDWRADDVTVLILQRDETSRPLHRRPAGVRPFAELAEAAR